MLVPHTGEQSYVGVQNTVLVAAPTGNSGSTPGCVTYFMCTVLISPDDQETMCWLNCFVISSNDLIC